jgi:tetratricopeptide (TPR) repeat protein
LEKKYQENPKYLDDRLIFHFEKSKKYNKCIFYSMLYAEKLKKLNLKETHSLVYYGKAMKYAIKLKRNYDLVNILIKMGDIYFEIDRIIDAKSHYFEAYRVAKGISSTELIVNSLNKIAFINFRCLDYRKALEGLQNVYEMAIENEYFEGEITSALLLIEYYNEVGDEYNFYALIDKYYNMIFDNEEEPYFSAKFKILMGNYNYKIEKYDDACECYYSAIDILKKIDKESETSQVLNSLGKIELEYFGRYENALEFFLIAEEIQQRNNIATDIAIFKVNAGTTYFRMERFEKALEAYEIAIDAALKTDDKRDFFSVSVEVIRGYLFLGEFEKAYSILKKLEIEYFSNSNYERMLD